MTLTEHRRLEYLGDGLYNFIAREVILHGTDYSSEKRRIINYVQCNLFMAAVAVKIGLIPHPKKFDTLDVYGNNSPYPYADQLEVRIYQEFLEGGFDQAKAFFIKNVSPYCKTLLEAIAVQKETVIPKYVFDNGGKSVME